MPEEKYVGSAMGAGNPPGKHSGSYLSSSEGEVERFHTKSSYETGMDVGVVRKAVEVGNQPKSSSTATLESHSNKTNSI